MVYACQCICWQCSKLKITLNQRKKLNVNNVKSFKFLHSFEVPPSPLFYQLQKFLQVDQCLQPVQKSLKVLVLESKHLVSVQAICAGHCAGHGGYWRQGGLGAASVCRQQIVDEDFWKCPPPPLLSPHAVLSFTESRVHSFGSKLLSSPAEVSHKQISHQKVSHQKITHQQLYLHTAALPPMLFEQMLLLLDDVHLEFFHFSRSYNFKCGMRPPDKPALLR